MQIGPLQLPHSQCVFWVFLFPKLYSSFLPLIVLLLCHLSLLCICECVILSLEHGDEQDLYITALYRVVKFYLFHQIPRFSRNPGLENSWNQDGINTSRKSRNPLPRISGNLGKLTEFCNLNTSTSTKAAN